MERREQSIRLKLREEIRQYAQLKNAWGLGHIRVQIVKTQRGCTCKYCMKEMKIIGYYRDYYELTKQTVHLGRSYANALSRLNHVKSFL